VFYKKDIIASIIVVILVILFGVMKYKGIYLMTNVEFMPCIKEVKR
jgi:hypothetical protein